VGETDSSASVSIGFGALGWYA